MKKRYFILSLSALMTLAAAAAPLTPGEALQRARKNGPARMAAKIPASAKPVYSAKSESGVTGAYVFNNPGAGYVILAADDVAYPVLGYSDSGSIDVNNMSPELKWWIGQYARQIEWATEHGAKEAKGAPGYRAERKAIPALIKTKWNQDAPYYNDCPTPKGSDQRCYTGCVATSMAQVMNYHKYPDKGEGIKQYQCSSLGRKLTLNFGQKAFDWDNMLNAYPEGGYNEAQAAAVAYLMKACGYSVEMNYGTDSSGASGSAIAPALVKYFKYDPHTSSVERNLYSGSQWEQMVYDNLANIGPLIINGQSPLQGGHSFVCDGYDGNGYYHFNWGWGGMSDGYFSLDALNPDAQGIGGFTGGFNFMQNGIFGVQPPTGEVYEREPEKVLQYGSTTVSLNARTATFGCDNYSYYLGWTSTSDSPCRFNIGAIIEPASGNGQTRTVKGKMGSMEEFEIYQGPYYDANKINPVVDLPELPDGRYKVILASRDLSMENPEWLPVAVPWGLNNYFMLDVAGGNYTATVVPVSSISVSDFRMTSGLYSTKYVRFEADVANNTDIELCQGVTPHLFDTAGNLKFVGESILFSLNPGQNETKVWNTRFYNTNGSLGTVTKATEFTMRLYDPQFGRYYDGIEAKVTMEPNPGAASLQFSKCEFPGSTAESVTVNDREFYRVFVIPNPAGAEFDVGFKVTRGYFDGQISIDIYQQDPENPNYDISLYDDVWNATPFLSKGQSADYVIPMNYDFNIGTVYSMNITYTEGMQLRRLGQIYFMFGESGVDDIISDADGDVEYFNLQGVRVANPQPGQLLIVRKGGKTWKQVVK